MIIKAQIFISPIGNDNNKGTFNSPLKTLEKAKNLLPTFKTKDTLHIYLRQGTYNITTSFQLDDNNLESNKFLSIEPYKKEIVILKGSTKISPSLVHTITDASVKAKIKTQLIDSIFEIDIHKMNINNNKKFADVFDGDGNLLQLFVNNQRQRLSRYPNEGYMTIKKVIINGGGQETKEGDWREYYSDDKKNKKELPPRPGVFEYRDTRENFWWNTINEGNAWLKGYWRIPWQNEAARIGKIDTLNKTITLAAPIQGGIGSKYHRPEGSGKERYWAFNLIEEIDEPGEWAIDFIRNKIYIYPSANIRKFGIYIADNANPLIHLNNTKNVIIKGITIQENLGDGIRITNGENNTIEGCTINNILKYAAYIKDGFRNKVVSCDMFNLGIGGVWLSGGDEKSTPRIPAQHQVINNHIHHYGEVQKVYGAAINAGFSGGGGGGHHSAVGMYIAHNMIHDAPHVGVLYGSWDNVFEYNEVFNYCLVSDDMGAFYCYDLFERNGNDTLRYNFIHNSSVGDAIYFDNDHRDMQVYGNIVVLNSMPKKRGSAYLFKIGSQKKNPQKINCYNNIAINCNYGFQFVSASLTNIIENNISVNCMNPFSYQVVKSDGAHDTTNILASGKNINYTEDPGFENLASYNFNIKKDSKIFKDLPQFVAPPFNKMGLFIDTYRKQLPSNKEVNRFSNIISKEGVGYDILDRN